MEYYDFNKQNESYEEDKEHIRMVDEVKKIDKGYNVIYRKRLNKRNKLVSTAIGIYTSGKIGSQIRDAETGVYYPHIVGSADEDLYFKVNLATGECKSMNGSSTLFYLSPRHYMSILNDNISENIIQFWEEKRNARHNEIELKKNKPLSIIVN